MEDTVSPFPSPSPRKQVRVRTHALRVILAVVQRLTGRALPPEQVLAALVEAVAAPGQPEKDPDAAPAVALVLRRRDLLVLLEEYRHQALIDRIAAWCNRALGPDAHYADAYSQYVDEAHSRGLTPYALKSFKNRVFKDPLQRKSEALAASNRHRRKHAA